MSERNNLPIPSHLAQYLMPVGERNTEFEVTGVIRCECGNDRFEVRESNGRHIVNAICRRCGREISVLDSGKHGYDGFVCGDDYLDRTLPPQKYGCEKCGGDEFTVTVRILSQGRQDFVDVCVADGSPFSPDDWVNGFEWITISLSCRECGFDEDGWVDLETM